MNFEKLKRCLDAFVDEDNTPGIDCIVYKNHELLFRYYKGMSDIENGKKMSGNELYLIFSMTKMITCTAALQMFEKGKYSLSDPISDYLPEFKKMKISYCEEKSEDSSKIMRGAVIGESTKTTSSGYAKNSITVKDLFTMSAGLDYDLKDDAISNALKQGKKTTREIVGAMSEKILTFEPGTRFKYSLCHDVLGALIEVWSGRKLGEYMRENIFIPLGMENTFFGIPMDEKNSSKMAAIYYRSNGILERCPLKCTYNVTDEYESGGAGLTSCTEDYALFLDALACGGVGKNGNRILSEDTVELMRKNHLTGKQLENFYDLRPGYGYGLGVRTHLNREKSGALSPLGEFGWDGAAGAFSLVDVENKISLTYFQHMHNWDVKMQNEIKNALYGQLEQGNQE